jgi:hypothetical protein
VASTAQDIAGKTCCHGGRKIPKFIGFKLLDEFEGAAKRGGPACRPVRAMEESD